MLTVNEPSQTPMQRLPLHDVVGQNASEAADELQLHARADIFRSFKLVPRFIVATRVEVIRRWTHVPLGYWLLCSLQEQKKTSSESSYFVNTQTLTH